MDIGIKIGNVYFTPDAYYCEILIQLTAERGYPLNKAAIVMDLMLAGF